MEVQHDPQVRFSEQHLAQRGTPLPTPAPATIFKPLAEGGVLFSTEHEVYFGVNEIGARIWHLLPPATNTLEELVDRLTSQFHDVSEAHIRRDVRKFLDDLTANGLAVPRAEEGESEPPAEADAR